jgi:pilus assembly protein Flp/PilA
VVQVAQFIAAWMTAAKTREDEGQGLVEYALIIALVSIMLIGALATLRGGIGGTFDSIAGELGG